MLLAGAKKGLTVGIPQTDPILKKTLGWVRFKKGTDVAKFFTQIDTNILFNAPFDTVRKEGSLKKKKFVKELSPNVKAYTNPFLQEFTVFKMNVYSSIYEVTPPNFEVVKYILPGSEWNNFTMFQFVKRIDSVLTYFKTFKFNDGDSAKVGAAKLENIRQLLISFNNAFDTTISLSNGDSVTAGHLYFPGKIPISNVPYLKSSNKSESGQFILSEAIEPVQHSLLQNYPNPFNPVTMIRFSIPVGAIHESPLQVTLKVYDVLGREVATLLNNETMEEGEHEVQFDAGNLPSGIYFYRINVTQQGLLRYSETKKLVLMK